MARGIEDVRFERVIVSGETPRTAERITTGAVSRNGIDARGHVCSMRRTTLPRLLPSALAVAGVLPAMTVSAGSSEIHVKDVRVLAGDATTIASAKGSAVKVTGGGTAVALRPTRATKTKQVSFGIRHVDEGTHAFAITFGPGASHAMVFSCDGVVESDAPTNAVEIQCDTFQPAGKVEIQCDIFQPAGKVELQCDAIHPVGKPGSATIVPRFAGAKTYSIRVTKKGKVLHDLSGQSGAFTIPDFEDSDEGGKAETLRVKIAYGVVRSDAWTITVVHEAFRISLTPDAAQPFEGIGEISLRTKGLDEVVLTKLAAK